MTNGADSTLRNDPPTADVTVIIPAYNAERFLGVTLQSLREQTTPPARVVVVDDGSTDGTATVAEAGGAIVIRQQQKGPAAARNRGLQAATTEFVAFLDADDWYVPDKLQRSIQALQELKAKCVATDAWVVRDGRMLGHKNQGRRVPSVLTTERLLRDNPVICSSVVARRAAVEAAKGFDENPDLIATEDFDLWLRLSQVEPIAYLDLPLTFYRVHPASLSNNLRFLKGLDRILDRFARQHEGEAHFQNLVRRRRADVRLDVAWDLIGAGKRQEARAMIAEADGLQRTWKGLRMRLRSLLPR
jgi:glycosyltransferase involved in cell wall biosynthesis